MNNRIQILPEHVANRIAAGEVVERPASVVKELVENAIDAGADEIVIHLKNGGRNLVQVIDNGCGMNHDDAILCLERHATSKIADWEDLLKVRSFGFRGEALASIASVSDTEIKTKTAEADVATVIRTHGGRISDVTQEAGLVGTTVSVKNLFHTVPARKNFLKTSNTEFRYAANQVKRFAAAYPEIEFTLLHDDEKVFQLRKSDLAQRLEKVIGRDVMASTLPVEHASGTWHLKGYISKPGFSFKTRGDQYLYINGRPVTSRSVNYAVFSAYGHSIPRGDKPFFVLFLQCDPEDFDVNVHPTKAEVKFRDEQLFYRFFYHAVHDAMNTDALIPTLSGPSSQEFLSTVTQESLVSDSPLNLLATHDEERSTVEFGSPVRMAESAGSKTRVQQQLTQRPSVQVDTLVWQLHNRYIISQIRSGLAIIDQHVAHERILYEKALDAFENAPMFSQQLLFPQTIEMSHEEFSIVEPLLPLLEKLGFVIKIFGKRTLIVEAVPADVRLGNEQKIIRDMIEYYAENQESALDPRDNLAKSFSCKSAIKSGDPLTIEEMNGLIDQLFATKFPYVCPHGRPIIIQLSLDELDKRFMRTP